VRGTRSPLNLRPTEARRYTGRRRELTKSTAGLADLHISAQGYEWDVSSGLDGAIRLFIGMVAACVLVRP